ncbi:Arm DNA-binding domain-containing protein [Candidatus Binatia bacterium]|nr:Arm DNA-binding domain-containing protein [Candidatus Binatia bacterium]
MPKLTKRAVDTAAPRDREWVVRDSELKGFNLGIAPNGRKVYTVEYRTAGGRRGSKRRVTLGVHGVLTADGAREKAKTMLARVRLGEDPSAARRAERTVPTMRASCRRPGQGPQRPHRRVGRRAA